MVSFSVLTLDISETSTPHQPLEENTEELDCEPIKKRSKSSKPTKESLQKVVTVLKEVFQKGGHDSDSYILDIDLDFFSTQNPFQNEYTEKQYSLLKKLYSYEAPKLADDKVSR